MGYTKKYIKENILLDNHSFKEINSGKIEGKCMLDGVEMAIRLPKSINNNNVLKAIENDNLTKEILDKIIEYIYKITESKKQNIHWLRARVDEEMYQRVQYWAEKRRCSVNEYLNLSLDHMIRWENQDYELPTLEQQRLNQLINSINALTSDVRCLEHITTNGFKSLIGLTRGDNYLLDEDGEL